MPTSVSSTTATADLPPMPPAPPSLPGGMPDMDELLRAGFGGLALADAALPARTAAFVASGADPDVVRDLHVHSGPLGLLLGWPGRLTGRRQALAGLDPRTGPAAHAGMAARHALYRQAGSDATGVARLARLGQVLEAADRGQHLDRTCAAMPAWLQYLLNDALYASYPDDDAAAWATQEVRDAMQAAARPAWDATLIAALLAHDGQSSSLLLPILFERTAIDYSMPHKAFPRLMAPGALDDYLLAHPGEMAAVGATAHDHGRIRLLAMIAAHPALLAVAGAVIVKLATSHNGYVRAPALERMHAIEPHQRLHHLAALLASGTEDEQTHVIALLARLHGEDAIPVFEAALALETPAWTRQRLQNKLSRLRACSFAGDLGLPVPLPLPPAPTEVLREDVFDLLLANRATLLARLRAGADAEIAANAGAARPTNHRQAHHARYAAMPVDGLRTAIAALNGDAVSRNTAVLLDPSIDETLELGGRLAAHPDFGLLQALRWVAGSKMACWETWYTPCFQAWLGRQDVDTVDLRQLAALAEGCGGPLHQFALAGMVPDPMERLAPQARLPAARIWPLYAARPALIDEGLNLVHGVGETDLGCTLAILATFPAIPARWLPRLMELALGDSTTHRAAVQQVLARVPDIAARASVGLQSTKQETRIETARWLARIGDQAGLPALRAALGKESRETVSAVLLSALEALGEDMAPHLAPATLLTQARKGLKAKAPAGMAWLDLDTAPACTWDAGGAVDPELVRWWTVLAIKLKEPGGNALLARYLGLLAPASRMALGRWVLHQFIARDTLQEAKEVVDAWVQAEADTWYRHNQRKYQAHPHDDYYRQQAALTLAQLAAQARRTKASEYLGTAIGEKGMLALAWAIPGQELTATIAAFMREHHLRRGQIEAMLEAAGASDEPAVIQFILGVARRHRTASVQEKARTLVLRIAERRGWSADQLADRTVPTAGFDDTGRLLLDYGSRTFTVTLDAAMKPVLHDADGKAVAALPEPRQNDAPEAAKEAKTQLAACKKELKLVIEMQTTRLYQAMCTGRAWPADEWRSYLQLHPVAGRLVQRLVWLTGTGTDARAFRPAEDGSLVDSGDNTVTLASGATVRLAHAALLSTTDAASWTLHCKDYKVTPLFAQMTRPVPPPLLPLAGSTLDDRLGWLSTAFALRTAVTKLGYQRGAVGSRAIFDDYVKDCGNWTVAIGFSGNAVPEENVTAALTALSFRRLDGRHPVPLEQVPPVLLAEARADYHAAAAACIGFDADWERKLPW